jgi:riboflavin synthase
LTVTDVSSFDFGVSIIQHTQDETTLTKKKIGDTVNLENDIVGKYIEKFVGNITARNDERLLNLLKDNNF